MKEPTIYDLAEGLDLSTSTVSRALSNYKYVSKETRRRVSDFAKKVGYRKNNFASQLKQQKTHTIGVIAHELNSTFITSVLSGIEKVATESRYNIIIGQSGESGAKEMANVDHFFRQRVDGLITSLACDTKTLDHYYLFVERGIPIVFFDRVAMDAPGVKVVIDNKGAGYNATKHLIEQGCKRIMHVTHGLSKNIYADRLAGFKQAVLEHKQSFGLAEVVVTKLSEQSGIEVARQILSMKIKPDGLFFTTDLCASVCMQHLKKNGIRIPQDIAIVGFNNDVISRVVEPALTTVNYSGMEMGEVAARTLLVQLCDGVSDNTSHSIEIGSDLIIRNSSLKRAPICESY